jgi:hypothetical protein
MLDDAKDFVLGAQEEVPKVKWRLIEANNSKWRTRR